MKETLRSSAQSKAELCYHAPMTTFILMGVAGSGKTTVGKRVAAELNLPFYEGDDYHPSVNVAKMSSGIPLTDEDRVPWIDALVHALNENQSSGAIVACSALSRFVRDRIRAGLRGAVHFIWLSGRPEVIEARLRRRGGHYMKANMLASQLAALQEPSTAHRVSIEQPIEQVTAEVLAIVRRLQTEGSSRFTA